MSKSSKRRIAHIEQWRRKAALNYATAASLIAWGADEEFVQPLRDRAAEWEAEADRLEKPMRKRGNANSTET